MKNKRTEIPLVLCFSGHDPSGGAGLQADIEAIAAGGGHALGVITAHTVQDTRDVARVAAPALELVRAQAEAVIADSAIRAVKIGLLGEPAQAAYIGEVVRRLKVPAILDPVLRAGGGAQLADDALAAALLELMREVELITPNAAEARRLAPRATDLDACGGALLDAGARDVLITGGDEPGDSITNTWYAPARAPHRFNWKRLDGPFHGAGCTLASAIAVRRARGMALAEALMEAQAYTHAALERARAVGRGRRIPGRLP